MDTDTDHGHAIPVDIFVSAEEAATLAGVSARTVRRWINSGDVQAADGPKGRTVSVSDVRRRAALGHDRSRPSRPNTESQTDVDTDGHAIVSAMSASIAPQLIEITVQIERLTREIGEANTRAVLAEMRADQLQRERDEATQRLDSDRVLTDQIVVSLESERDILKAELDHLRATFDVDAHRALLTAEDHDDVAGEDAPVSPSEAPGREEVAQGVESRAHHESHVAGWLRKLLGRS